MDFTRANHRDHAGRKAITAIIHMQYAAAIQHIKQMMAIGVIMLCGGIAWVIDDSVRANGLRVDRNFICDQIKAITGIAGRMQMR